LNSGRILYVVIGWVGFFTKRIVWHCREFFQRGKGLFSIHSIVIDYGVLHGDTVFFCLSSPEIKVQNGVGDVIRPFRVAHVPANLISHTRKLTQPTRKIHASFPSLQRPFLTPLLHKQEFPPLRRPMLKSTYSNGSTSAVLRHRQTRNLLVWLLIFLVSGSLWWYMFFSPPSIQSGSPPQSSVYIHKTEGEIDVLAWPEERWFEGPRNETQLEKAALIMLVR
jgi:hypothetical protein